MLSSANYFYWNVACRVLLFLQQSYIPMCSTPTTLPINPSHSSRTTHNTIPQSLHNTTNDNMTNNTNKNNQHMSQQQHIPKIILHGGYINESNLSTKPYRQASIQRILDAAYAQLLSEKLSAMDCAVLVVSMLEDDELFNAGTGSRIQSDGVIRMTASLMDSTTKKMSGVVNIEGVKNPIQVARALQHLPTDNILAGPCAQQWARDNGFEYFNTETAVRKEEWLLNKAKEEEEKQKQKQKEQQNKTTEEQPPQHKTGTVGAVVLDANGVLAAATSTGGKGGEIPGRVSDSGNVSGCFVNNACGVSITGVGENAISISMASAICIRRKDGKTLDEAVAMTMADLEEIRGVSGAVCLDAQGNFAHQATVSGMCWGLHDGEKVHVFE